ncbi:MAG TPA: MBL fold metallo-hydrolase [Chthoniobacterales bacterium]|nr:MBL fold metallo-hydrolase [Chthoniobacterales bacterium]
MTIRLPFFLAVALALSGCGLWPFSHRNTATQAPQQQRLVRVDWYGYQCFRIKSALGISILTNPFAPNSTDFTPPKNLTPELILSTTESADANYVDLVDNTPHILRSSVGVGTNTSSGIRILGVPIFKNPATQDIAGMNVIYRWTMDNLKFCFLGELQTVPSPQDLDRLGNVDVLFIPVSETDLSATQRQQIIQALRPQVIVPMGRLSDMNRFAAGYSAVYRLNGTAALLSREALPAVQTVLLFRAP